MTKEAYLPEGGYVGTRENSEALSSLSSMERAMRSGRILEAVALMCDRDLTLHFDFCGLAHGIMKKEEAMFCRGGETVKDIAILTRVGKPVCFKIIEIKDNCDGLPTLVLSRREAQREFCEIRLPSMRCGDIIDATVTHLESFGAFLDVGCGISSLLSVDSISVSRISHPKDRLACGDRIKAIVRSVDKATQRICLSQKELLGTWEENACEFSPGQTVTGIVRSVESYGIFVELTPNLAGLAEISDADGYGSYESLIGRRVAVYIKSIIPERMKIKLVLIDKWKNDLPTREKGGAPRYYVDFSKTDHIDEWVYSPSVSKKRVESVFS